MTRFLQILFEIDIAIAEGRLGFRLRGVHGDLEILLGQRHLHAAPTTSRRRLDDDRIADIGSDLAGFRNVADAALGTGHHWNAEFLCCQLGGDLVAHDADMLGTRSDELDAVLAQDVGKARILGEKPVAGMNGFRPGNFTRRDDGGNVEITVAGRRWSDAHAFVGQPDVHRIGVGGRMHSHRLDAELAAGAQHAKGNFAPIGDEDLVEHGLLDRHERFAVFNRMSGIDEDVRDLARTRRMELVHRLHRFDDEECLAFLHHRTDFDEIRRTR